MMKKILCLVAIVFATSKPSHAQDLPKAEFAVTYNMLVADIDALDNETNHGWGIAAQVNMSKFFAVVAEYTAAHGSSGPLTLTNLGGATPCTGASCIPLTVTYPEIDTRFQSFMFGPRITMRKSRANVFLHYLLGVGNTKVEDEASDVHTGNGEFGMALGGGVDLHVGKKVSLRLAQLDYMPIHTDINTRLVRGGTTATETSSWLHHTRFQMGIVFLAGSK